MEKYNIKEHKDEIITSIIKNLIWAPIAALIPIGYNLINTLYLNIKNGSDLFTVSNILIAICLLLSVTSIIICIKLSCKYRKKSSSEDPSSIQDSISSDFRFSTIVAELIFDDNRINITSTIDYNMTVLAESVTELKRDLIWSGAKYKGTKLVEMNGAYDLIDSDRESSPFPYIIAFNTEKKRGDLITCKTETQVVDENYNMMPVYSFMVKYQIDKLVLRVIAPKGMIKNVKQAVYADRAKEIQVKQPVNIVPEYIRNLVRYTYEIDMPSLLYNYFIEWEFTNN